MSDNTISPICIPDPTMTFDENAKCTVAGWGKQQGNYVAHDVSRTARVQLIPRVVCNSKTAYGGSIHARAICGEYQMNKTGARSDACNQDSGSK